MKRKRFTEAFRLRVISEILSGTLSKEAARRHYGIKGKSTVLKWMRMYGVAAQKELKGNFTLVKAKKVKGTAETDKQRIAVLEEALRRAELKAEGYQRMILLAEEQLQIKIQKKSSTKRSGK